MTDKLEKLSNQVNKIRDMFDNNEISLQNIKVKLVPMQSKVYIFYFELYDREVDEELQFETMRCITNADNDDRVKIILIMGGMICNLHDMIFDSKLDYYKEKL